MTAPLAPSPPWPVVVTVAGTLIFAVVAPFADRDDWIGWASFLTMAAVAFGVWAMLIFGLALAVIRWWRE